MFSQAEENYIKTIYALEHRLKEVVSTNMIADQIKTKASSVTDMIKKLADKGVLDYQKYKGVQLSKKGKKIATAIVRKHRLWESFLVNKLDFAWDEVHDIAEQLEHIQSEALTDRLDQFLAFPSVDPHGDPIPDKNGNFATRKQVPLSELKINDESVLMGLKDSSSAFLKYLNHKKIALGHRIKVIEIESFDGAMEVKINNEILGLSEEVTKNLLVKEIE